jgi:hypothetical protein
MPEPGKWIVLTITADTAKAASALQGFFGELNKNLEKLGSMGDMLEGIGGKLEAVLSVAALIEFSREAIQASRSLAQLSAVLRSTGQASSDFQDELEQQRKVLSMATGVEEDEIVTAQRLLLSFGARRESMEKLTGLTLDYAAAMGTNAASAAEQLGRALSGGNIMLRGMRVEIDNSLPKAQQLAVLMEILSDRVGGQARAAFEAAAPDVQRFNVQLTETEKALGNVFLSDVASPFLSGLGTGLARLEEQFKEFNTSFPQLASAIKSLSGALGDLIGKISPAIAALGFLVLAVQAAQFGFSTLVTAVTLVKIGLTALGSESLATLGYIGAITTALYAGVEAWRAWQAASEAKRSAANAAASDEDLRSTIIGNIHSNSRSGAISSDTAHELEAQVNSLDRAALSADEYHKRLVQIATDLRHMVTPEGNTSNLQADLFAKKIAELKKSYEASSAAAKSHGALGAIALEDAKNEQAYNRGLISLEDYLKKRRDLLTKQATEEQIPIQKAIAVTTDELLKLKGQLDELEGGSNYAEYTRVKQEVDKLTLQKEKLETDLLVSKQNSDKRKSEQSDFEFQNPTTVAGGINLGFSDALRKMGSTAKDIANIVSTSIGTAFSSVSKGISSVIMGTETWHQAIRKIGQEILTSVVGSIVEMGVKWVMTHVLMRAASVATAALMKALGLEQQTTNNMTLVSGAAAGVGTAGAEGGWVGILIYLGVLAAALAAVVGLSGGFADGGFTGAGGRLEPAGVVHRGEYVFSAPAVQRLGVGNLESLHSSAVGGAQSPSGTPNSNVHLAFFDDKSQMDRWVHSTAFEGHIVDIMKRTSHLVAKG